ncbi:hypothetical protein [Saccharothrix syringae]|uniref:Uncharacterized protein n=1 Tax=Saccharothrix syringae TaxID=103733 RepID=A0A5Q0GY65_SACSY|nr:hypothetical protein [Saccharothrix syringae]QFZ18921.1 hypothetical protein EKG83_17005 [Saccharothrix syringae]
MEDPGGALTRCTCASSAPVQVQERSGAGRSASGRRGIRTLPKGASWIASRASAYDSRASGVLPDHSGSRRTSR